MSKKTKLPSLPPDPVPSPLVSGTDYILDPVPSLCKNCHFWEQKDHRFGICRESLAPVIDSTKLTPYGPLGLFLVTESNSWCGQHRSKSSTA